MKRHIILLAHNIRSLWNVGALFRTCDCFGVQKVYLTGYTAVPPRREISKTALGAEEWIVWEYVRDPLEVIARMRKERYRIVALEQDKRAVALQEYLPPAQICLIIGHEVLGVPQELRDVSDDIVHIPMFGKKESLNVSVASGIALAHLRTTVS
ncbi:MAG: RNA methyltransferase [Candidatus Peribacteraceae bacterium]|nr:RNA methyltransferase [Candidatus Peribacteria bacterium]